MAYPGLRTRLECFTPIPWKYANQQCIAIYFSTVTYNDRIEWRLQLNVRCFKYDVDTGAISEPQVVVTFDKEKHALPDGHCIDADGNLWVAMFGLGGILKVDTTKGWSRSRSVGLVFRKRDAYIGNLCVFLYNVQLYISRLFRSAPTKTEIKTYDLFRGTVLQYLLYVSAESIRQVICNWKHTRAIELELNPSAT